MKTCSGRREEKPLSEFWRQARSRDGRQHYCKSCQTEKNEAWASANPERRAAAKRAAGHVWRYGITYEQRDALLVAQGGVCAICRTDRPGGRWGEWHLDHDHVTKTIRGLLCNDCNAGIGILKDDPDRLRRAADYLERER